MEVATVIISCWMSFEIFSHWSTMYSQPVLGGREAGREGGREGKRERVNQLKYH